jgi:hypothetical protein
MKSLCALMLLLTVPASRAQQDDPLKSPACGAALAALQAARQDGGDAARTETLRSQAATTCLGMPDPRARPSRALQAPIAVPPPRIDVPPVARSLPPPTLPPPPVAMERLPAPANCDGTGCWVNDGSHLQRVPPTLVGPQGLCTQQGGQLYCP